MKRISSFALVLTLSVLTFTSCKKDLGIDSPVQKNPTEGTHFDVWSPIGMISGMGSNNHLVKTVTSLEEGELSFEGSGVDLSQKLYPHVVIKDKYYYQLTKEGRFGKYQIKGEQLITIKEFPFTTLKERKYCHTWIDNHTLLLMGASGDLSKILWSKIDTDAMTEIESGELALPAPPSGLTFNTSGMCAYRQSDNMILYSFVYNGTGAGAKKSDAVHMAFIHASDMKVKATVEDNRAEMMASTSFGELRQNKSFFDENGDYYLACNSILVPSEGGTTAQHGALLRVKKGALDFDKTYNGYKDDRGKIITANYLNNGKAILYMEDPMHTSNTKDWRSKTNPYRYYFIVLDLKTSQFTYLDEIPYSNGGFSQLVSVVGDKAYIGANPKDEKAQVFVYDILTGKLSPGMTLAKGSYIDRLVWIQD